MAITPIIFNFEYYKEVIGQLDAPADLPHKIPPPPPVPTEHEDEWSQKPVWTVWRRDFFSPGRF